MKTLSLCLLSALVLAAAVAHAQEEQSSSSSADPSERYWTAARIQQEPPRKESRPASAKPNPNPAPLVIENEWLEVKGLLDSSRLQVTYKPSGKIFLTDGSFNATGGSAKISKVS